MATAPSTSVLTSLLVVLASFTLFFASSLASRNLSVSSQWISHQSTICAKLWRMTVDRTHHANSRVGTRHCLTSSHSRRCFTREENCIMSRARRKTLHSHCPCGALFRAIPHLPSRRRPRRACAWCQEHHVGPLIVCLLQWGQQLMSSATWTCFSRPSCFSYPFSSSSILDAVGQHQPP